MKKIVLQLTDQVNCRFVGLDPTTSRKFSEALKFMVPHARHTVKFKLKRWDGKISFGGANGATYINLLDRVLPLILAAGYEIEIEDQRPDHAFTFAAIEEDVLADRFWPPGHVMAGLPIMLRDYQVAAINGFLSNTQSVQEISTGAGKTLLCAVLSRCVQAYGRSIIIVPSKDLVRQTEADYRHLGLDVGIFYGERKEFGHTHTICTWQSLAVFSKKSARDEAPIPIEAFLVDVVCVMVDEVHAAKATELRNLLCGPMADIPLRWGLTGTIPKDESEFVALLAALGPVAGRIEASDLQDQGVLANCEVNIIQMRDEHVEFPDWETEYKFLVSDPDRLTYIAQYCDLVAESGNTLILVERRETGFALEKLIPDAVFVHGETKSAERSAEFGTVQISEGKKIIATYGIASVGINMPRIFNLVLFEAGKSFVRVIQSIGRGLRRARDKDHVNITDFCSTLKFSARHASKRRGFYNDAKYRHSTVKVDYRNSQI